MQPARADVVHSFTVPASAATAGERHIVRMSFPSCGPWPRGCPKSSKYFAAPTTGKKIGVAVVAGIAPGSIRPAEADTAMQAAARTATEKARTAVGRGGRFRWFRIRRVRRSRGASGPSDAARTGRPYQSRATEQAGTGCGGCHARRDGGRDRLAAVKIVVCVKQVPDANAARRIDPATNRLDRSGEGALNATDVNAVEEALRIKEAQGGEVVVASLGPAKAL